MVISCSGHRKGQRASLLVEVLVATAILLGALVPIAYAISSEYRVARYAYRHTVAMEIVDGEMEVLVAGGWRAFPFGTNAYPVSAFAATNLPPGDFLLTVQSNRIRLEWQPGAKAQGGRVVREAVVQ